MVIESMMPIMKIHRLKEDPISDNDCFEDLVFQSTLGTAEHVWSQPTKVIGSTPSFHGCLTTCKEPRKSLDTFCKYSAICYSKLYSTTHN